MDAGLVLVGVGIIAFIGYLIWFIVRSLNWDSKIPPIIGMLLSVVMVAGGLFTMQEVKDLIYKDFGAQSGSQEDQNTAEETQEQAQEDTGEEIQ